MIRLTENVISRYKENFKFFMSEKYNTKKSEFKKTKLKCDCGCDFVKLHNFKLMIPYRHTTKYIDLKNKFADVCFECGRELEYIDTRDLIKQNAEAKDITINQRDLLLQRVEELNNLLITVKD